MALMCRVCAEREAIGSRLLEGKPAWVTDDFGRFNPCQQVCERHLEESALRQGERVLSLEEARALVEKDLRDEVQAKFKGSAADFLGSAVVRAVLIEVMVEEGRRT